MADPFSAVGTAIKLAELCLRLKDVSYENRVFLSLIDRVRKDLNEALRERQGKSAILQSIPGKRAWIDGAIRDTQQALNEVGRLVEDARIDEEQGKPVTLKHRFDWVLSNHQKFVTKERALATCHQSLLGAITTMQNISAPPTSTLLSPPSYTATTQEELGPQEVEGALMSPFRRRPLRSVTDTSPLEAPTVAWDSKTDSGISLPEIESSIDGAWTRSLLQITSPQIGDFPGDTPTTSSLSSGT